MNNRKHHLIVIMCCVCVLVTQRNEIDGNSGSLGSSKAFCLTDHLLQATQSIKTVIVHQRNVGSG